MISIREKNAQRRKMVALITIFLTICLGFAAIAHQFDTLPTHHSQHDCQLFTSIHHGVHTPDLTLPVVMSHGYIEPVAETIRVSRPLSAYEARSPPITVLSMNYISISS